MKVCVRGKAEIVRYMARELRVGPCWLRISNTFFLVRHEEDEHIYPGEHRVEGVAGNRRVQDLAVDYRPGSVTEPLSVILRGVATEAENGIAVLYENGIVDGAVVEFARWTGSAANVAAWRSDGSWHIAFMLVPRNTSSTNLGRGWYVTENPASGEHVVCAHKVHGSVYRFFMYRDEADAEAERLNRQCVEVDYNA